MVPTAFIRARGEIMGHTVRISHLVVAVALLFVVGCPGDHRCEDDLPKPTIGPNGERIVFSQLTSNNAVPCPGLERRIDCIFRVDIRAEGLREPATAQLSVQIVKGANGDEVCREDEPAVFLQGSRADLTPNQPVGQLTGTLGPPVTDSVRFNLAIELRDATGRLIAASEPLLNLRPQ